MSTSPPPGLLPGGRFGAWRPAPPRLVACDVDGTLLGDSHLPSPAVMDGVKAAQRAGCAVGVATGREWAGVRTVVQTLGLRGPHVLHNGAEVREDPEVVVRWPLQERLARDLLEAAERWGWCLECYVGDGFVVTDARAAAQEHWDLLEATPDGLTSDLDLSRDVVVKATVIVFDPAELTATVTAVRSMGANAAIGVAPLTPSLTYVNITHPDVDKGVGLARAAAATGVGLDGVAVLGDGLNDVALFAPAGTAIAMGQAPDEVHAAAHLVAPSVAQDGAAVALLALARALD